MSVRSISFLLTTLVSGYFLVSADTSCGSAEAALEDLSTAANNSYFLKWRPKFHFQAPNSWMNGLYFESYN